MSTTTKRHAVVDQQRREKIYYLAGCAGKREKHFVAPETLEREREAMMKERGGGGLYSPHLATLARSWAATNNTPTPPLRSLG